jgi:PP-loop superfamily ATP-utilizing enzyme
VREQVVREFKRIGYGFVTIDLAGYRLGGGLNEMLPMLTTTATPQAEPAPAH